MVLVAFHHAYGAAQVIFQKKRVICQRTSLPEVISHPVALNIGLVDHVDPVFVGQPVEELRLRVVACTHGIDVVFAEQFKIFSHQFFGDVMAGMFIMFMQVHPFQQYRLPVHKELAVFNFRCTETYFQCCRFKGASLFVHQLNG